MIRNTLTKTFTKTIRNITTTTIKKRYVAATKRTFSSTTFEDDVVEVYTGAFAKPLRLVKRISLTSVGASVLGSGILIASDPTLGMIGLGTVLSSFGVGTTAMLHWLTKPYITTLYVRNGESNVFVKTLTLTGKESLSEFLIEDIAPPSASHPFSVFHAKGREYHISADSVDDLYVANALSEVMPDKEEEDEVQK